MCTCVAAQAQRADEFWGSCLPEAAAGRGHQRILACFSFILLLASNRGQLLPFGALDERVVLQVDGSAPTTHTIRWFAAAPSLQQAGMPVEAMPQPCCPAAVLTNNPVLASRDRAGPPLAVKNSTPLRVSFSLADPGCTWHRGTWRQHDACLWPCLHQTCERQCIKCMCLQADTCHHHCMQAGMPLERNADALGSTSGSAAKAH